MKKGDLQSSGQGFFGDLAFRVRLFMNPRSVVEALNHVEAVDECYATAFAGMAPLSCLGADGRDRSATIVSDLISNLSDARAKLRGLVFGREPLAHAQFDAETALIDRGDLQAGEPPCNFHPMEGHGGVAIGARRNGLR